MFAVTFRQSPPRVFDLVVGARRHSPEFAQAGIRPGVKLSPTSGPLLRAGNIDGEVNREDAMYNEPGRMAATGGPTVPAFFVFTAESLDYDRKLACARYESKFRGYAEVSQKVNAGSLLAPSTRLGLYARNRMFSVAALFKGLMKLMDHFATDIELDGYGSPSSQNHAEDAAAIIVAAECMTVQDWLSPIFKATIPLFTAYDRVIHTEDSACLDCCANFVYAIQAYVMLRFARD